MTRNRIQKLLLQSEYKEFKDNVLAEAPFIELNKCGEPLRQVVLGLTENCFIVASEKVPDYVKFPYVKYDADVDLDIDSLELEWIVPVGFVEIVAKSQNKIISVDTKNKRAAQFMISNIWGSAKNDWFIWNKALSAVYSDPYSYIRCLFKDWAIPDNIHDNALSARRRSQIDKAKSLECPTNKIMTKMCEIKDEIASRSSAKVKGAASVRNDIPFIFCTAETGNRSAVLYDSSSEDLSNDITLGVFNIEPGSQTSVSYDSNDEDELKKKRKKSKVNIFLRGLFCCGKPKRRPS